jgi:hypothetical protein
MKACKIGARRASHYFQEKNHKYNKVFFANKKFCCTFAVAMVCYVAGRSALPGNQKGMQCNSATVPLL